MKKLISFIQSDSFKSFLHTFWTDLLWESTVAAAFTHILSNGDISKTALSTLGYAIFRTFLRDLREFLKKKYPKVDTTKEKVL